MKKQIGKFRISARLVREEPEKALAIMRVGEFLVVRAEMLYVGDVIEYTALSPLFASVDRNTEIPSYDLRMVSDGDNLTNLKVGVIKR